MAEAGDGEVEVSFAWNQVFGRKRKMTPAADVLKFFGVTKGVNPTDGDNRNRDRQGDA